MEAGEKVACEMRWERASRTRDRFTIRFQSLEEGRQIGKVNITYDHDIDPSPMLFMVVQACFEEMEALEGVYSDGEETRVG